MSPLFHAKTRFFAVFLFAFTGLMGLSACSAETPSDGFTHFIEAVLQKNKTEAFARLSPESQNKVALSLARYTDVHPDKRMSPAEYLFFQGSLESLEIGVHSIEVRIVKEPWARVDVTTLKGDVLHATMKKVGNKWTFHTETAPDFLQEGTP